MLIHNPIFTGSISLNGADISQISTVSSDSSSFASRITNTESTASAYVLASGSLSTRVTATEATASAYVTASGSLSTRVTAAEATASAYVTASGSLSARIASNEAKTGSFATTGSNQFNGNQTVTGSLTATGTIVAQTLVVQTITSSVEFVTGSNRFGTTTGNTHEFTGSLLVSGSGYVNGSVGIGITTPSSNSRLHVYRGGGNYDTIVADGDAGTNTGFGIYEAGSAKYALYSNGAGGNDSFNIYNFAASSNSLTILANGNIGIGTTNPSNKLSISNDGNSVIAFRINDTNANTSFLSLNASNSDAAILAGGTSAIPFDIYTSGSIRMRITAGGNIGIGTTNPVGGGGASDKTLSINAATGAATFITGLIDGTRYSTLFTAVNSVVLETNAAIPLAFNTNSTERMRITAGGNIGIGTTNPTRKFDIISTGEQLRLSYDGSTTYTDFRSDSAGGLLVNTSGGYIIHYIGGSEKMRLTSDGNVGIGITNPSAKLHVADFIIGTCTTSYNGDGIRVYASATGAAGSQPGIGFWTAAGSKRFITQLDVSSDTWNVVNATGVNHMTILQGGNVGVGTTNPGTKLHVVGGNDNTLIIDNDGSTYTSAFWRNNNSNRAQIYFQNSAKEFGIGTLDASGYIAFSTAVAQERMRINSSGNVGIGVTNHTAKLQVRSNNQAAAVFQTGDQNYIMLGKVIQSYGGTSNTSLLSFNVSGNTGYMFKIVIRGVNAVSDVAYEDVAYASWYCIGGGYQNSHINQPTTVVNIAGSHNVGTLSWANVSTAPVLRYSQGSNGYILEAIDIYVTARDGGSISFNVDYVNAG